MLHVSSALHDWSFLWHCHPMKGQLSSRNLFCCDILCLYIRFSGWLQLSCVVLDCSPNKAFINYRSKQRWGGQAVQLGTVATWSDHVKSTALRTDRIKKNTFLLLQYHRLPFTLLPQYIKVLYWITPGSGVKSIYQILCQFVKVLMRYDPISFFDGFTANFKSLQLENHLESQKKVIVKLICHLWRTL